MRQLNLDLKTLQARHREGAFLTRRDRAYALNQAADLLHALGFLRLRATGLKRKHVDALVAEWQRRGLAVGTVKNRMSSLRWWAEHVGQRPGRGAHPPALKPRHHRLGRRHALGELRLGEMRLRARLVATMRTNSLAPNQPWLRNPGPLCECLPPHDMIASCGQSGPPRLRAGAHRIVVEWPRSRDALRRFGLELLGLGPKPLGLRRRFVEVGFRAMLNGCGTGDCARRETRGDDMGRRGDWRPGYRSLPVGPIGGLRESK